eukprot:scaffold127348_cov72-Phaeocystis_antarctica.AAC.1
MSTLFSATLVVIATRHGGYVQGMFPHYSHFSATGCRNEARTRSSQRLHETFCETLNRDVFCACTPLSLRSCSAPRLLTVRGRPCLTPAAARPAPGGWVVLRLEQDGAGLRLRLGLGLRLGARARGGGWG